MSAGDGTTAAAFGGSLVRTLIHFSNAMSNDMSNGWANAMPNKIQIAFDCLHHNSSNEKRTISIGLDRLFGGHLKLENVKQTFVRNVCFAAVVGCLLVAV